MNFVKWLLDRVRASLWGRGTYDWVRNYRKLIMEEKPLSFLITILFGGLWVAVVALGSLIFVGQGNSQLIGNVVLTAMSVVPVFYVYHWIMALYGVYKDEQSEMWQRLKEHP